MQPRDSLYPADWQRIAEKDLQRVTSLLGIGDPEAAGFYLQQAVEKFLKAFLLSKGWKLERTHDLEVLLNEALAYDASLESFRQVCQKTTGFYFLERYPFTVESGLTGQDVLDARERLNPLIHRLREQRVQTQLGEYSCEESVDE
jgi:HEPN domain-containing protein